MGWLVDLLLESPVPPAIWLPNANERRSRARMVVDAIVRGRRAHRGRHRGRYLNDLRGGYHAVSSPRFVTGEEIDAAVDSALTHLNPPVLQGWLLLLCLVPLGLVLLALRAATMEDVTAFPAALVAVLLAVGGLALAILLVGWYQREVEVCDHGIVIRRWTDVWTDRHGTVIGMPGEIHARVHPMLLELDGPGLADLRIDLSLWPPSARRTLAEDLRALGLAVDRKPDPLLDEEGLRDDPPVERDMHPLDRPVPEIRTARLVLRGWLHADRKPFAAMNADPEVMRHFPSTLSKAASDRLVNAIAEGWAEHGFGLWAVERLEDGRFLGFTGLSRPAFDAPFMPAVEVGWRLVRDAWGRGYATEAALAAVAFGFESLGLDEIVSFTAPANERSRRVMERLGMTHDPDDDFDHPKLPEDHPLRRHVLYRLSRPAWEALRRESPR